ncbi:MAG: hypothetical protein L0Y74_10530, partial [candidate division Zixibacteria bacterium]|nr:hypothetical protein [candidate division Zixibacteria bacterium]
PSIRGDVNADCKVTLADVIALVNYLFKQVPIQGCPEWGEPLNMGSPPNEIGVAEYNPTITSNGLTLFFAKPTSPSGLEDIFYSYWNGSAWSEPVKLNNNINSSSVEQDPSISADGKKLYFSAYDWPGGYGLRDIWVSEWDTTMNDWGPATNLGPNINTGGREEDPSISADGMTLYFVSDSLSGQGIYRSGWTGSEWGPAVYFSEKVNAGYSLAPSISSDGLTLYQSKGTIFGMKAFVSFWDGSDWTQAESLLIANEGGTVAGPQVSFDGRRLFFYSSREGDTDLWIIAR